MFYAPAAKWEFSVESTAVDSGSGRALPYRIGYEHIVWNDLFYDKPSEEQLQELYDQSIEVYTSPTMYKTQRQLAYPPVEEQLDMIFHRGVDVWKEKIQQIKDSIPKVGGST